MVSPVRPKRVVSPVPSKRVLRTRGVGRTFSESEATKSTSSLQLSPESSFNDSDVTISYLGKSYSANDIFPQGHPLVFESGSETSLDALEILEPTRRSRDLQGGGSRNHDRSSMRTERHKPSMLRAMSKSFSKLGTSLSEMDDIDSSHPKSARSSLATMNKSFSSYGASTAYSSSEDEHLAEMIDAYGYSPEDIRCLTEDEERFTKLKNSLKIVGAVTNTSLQMGLHIYLRKEKRESGGGSF